MRRRSISAIKHLHAAGAWERKHAQQVAQEEAARGEDLPTLPDFDQGGAQDYDYEIISEANAAAAAALEEDHYLNEDEWVWLNSEPDLEMPRDVADERAFRDAAWVISARPFFSIFSSQVTSDEGSADDDQGAAETRGHPSPPPETARGGRAIPSLTLTPRLLAQRPQRARATRAGWL